MEQKDLLSLALAQTAQIGTYWTLYIAVTGTLIGVLTAEKLVLSSRMSRAITTLLFAAFSYSNLIVGIVGAVDVRNEALFLVTDPQLARLKSAGSGPGAWQYILFHLAFDIAALIVVWRLPHKRAGVGTN